MESHKFDREYVDRLAQGDIETGRHFIQYFTKILLAKMRAKMRSPSEAEDVVQETLLRVLRRLKETGIEKPEALGGYVNSFSENVLLEFFRESGRFQQVPENAPEPLERAVDAEMNCITDQRKELIRRELGKLNPKDRVVLERVFLLEQDKDTICMDLKIDRNYLRVQVHRALARFRKVLESKDRGSEGTSARKAAAG